MMHHIELGNTILSRRRKLKLLIEQGKITLGGNKQLKFMERCNANLAKE